ncbi:biliverdin-producing heme oxygenase [Parvularcula dongshanensis]|uniref:Heme oxygenase n=1 Tax=Parvularcula dongshanensis TaxID=1173995 RepID=A0A840I093_9PROT|nr:biliverdin-producing heme oxygenase [Parvularcula dongshanensis]MBB4657693.1 heme oxygenase [Parvularcula dongshanensis]
MTALRFELRTDTREAHETVDAVFDRFELGDPQGYAAFLRAHHAALTSLPLDPPPYGLPPIRLLPLLEADLAALGDLPPARPLLALPGEAERLGAYYVVAGSRLGGRVLERQWREAGGRGPGAYLSDRETDACWRALLDLLKDRSFPKEKVEAGARAAFDQFRAAGLSEALRVTSA